ncbi:MAG: acyl-CoA thioesterase [Rhodobacterales bacterium]|nr:acyl-CoA thioesterase [Rhodobacterales bacterium]
MNRFYEKVQGVYFDDLDPFRILHNARFLLLFERTLGSFWLEVGLGGIESHLEGGHTHLVRANTIEYLSPVRGTGNVRVRVRVHKLGRTSLTFAFRMMPMDMDDDYATGTRTVVSVDSNTQKPTPWHDDFRAMMAPWISE